MPKIKTTIDNDAAYMITFCTSGKTPWLSDPATAAVVEEAILFGQRPGWYQLFSYVIMPDHVHMALVPQKNISHIMHSIKSFTGHKLRNENKPLWQPAYYSMIISQESDLLSGMEYVERNPVRKELAENPEDYPFSFAGKRELMDSI